MAAVTTMRPHPVRGPRSGEGAHIAALWRELWDVHESWGSYAGSKDDEAYADVAARIEVESRSRGGGIVLGRHLHLVAVQGAEPLGQVEGWLDRFGERASTPWTCEVRSLVVAARARGTGLGRALLETLAAAAVATLRAPTFLVAEVLAPNPAYAFYASLGYAPISWVARVDDLARARSAYAARRGHPIVARPARPDDAYALAVLDGVLAARRRALGDLRFDPPSAIDATLIAALAARLDGAWAFGHMPLDIVVTDESGVIRASASLFVSLLEPPFIPVRRAILTRLSFDSAADPGPLMLALVPFAAQVATSWGAKTMEVSDLSAPGTDLHDAAIEAGARPWSTIVAKRCEPAAASR